MSKHRRPRIEDQTITARDSDDKARPDWPSAPFTGAKWGAGLGFISSMLFVNTSEVSAFGVSAYPGDAGVVIVAGLVGGALLGLLVGWIAMD